MKKLLALILCVMMFVSVIPTMAFAEDAQPTAGTTDTQTPAAAAAIDYSKYPWIDNPLMSLATYKKEIENMMKNTKEDIENAYAEFASNKVVYSTAKGMDDTVVGLVDALANNVMDKKIAVYKADGSGVANPEYKFTKTDADNIKDQIRLIVDKKVAEYMNDHEYQFVDKYKADGVTPLEIDPIKYAQTFGKAVSDTLTDKDFQKGYEAVATYFALASLVKDINDNLKDEYKAFKGDVDKKFDKDFTEKYPELVKEMNYIDTIAENNPEAFWAWDGVTMYPFSPDNGWESRS
jgi:hypothetical protein